jgi:hypothetical protein
VKVCRGRSERSGHDREEIGQRVALLLVKAGAIHVSRQQPFILAAGWASPVYVDCRVLIGAPQVRRAITDLALEFLSSAVPAHSFDAIAGAETAGIPFAAGSRSDPAWRCVMSASARSASAATPRSRAAPSTDCACF